MELLRVARFVAAAGLLAIAGSARSALFGGPDPAAAPVSPGASPTPTASVRHGTMSKAEIAGRMAKLRADAGAVRRDPGLKALQSTLVQELAGRQAAKNQKVALALQQALSQPVKPKNGLTVPKINIVVQTPPLSPGDRILILGEGFGGSEDGPPTPPEGGGVRLIGYFPPDTHLALKVLRWAPVYILAEVPPVSGVPDLATVTIQVVRAMVWSNQVDSSFRAAREVVWVGRAAIQVLACADADLANNACDPASGSSRMGSGFWAYHDYSDGECGSDQVRVTLGHGYTLHDSYVDPTYAHFSTPHPAVAAFLLGFQPGVPSADLTINWCYDGIGGIDYGLGLYAIGPKGLPYR